MSKPRITVTADVMQEVFALAICEMERDNRCVTDETIEAMRNVAGKIDWTVHGNEMRSRTHLQCTLDRYSPATPGYQRRRP